MAPSAKADENDERQNCICRLCHEEYYFTIRFSETIFEDNEDHTYEMEYEEPKNDGMHVKVQSNPINMDTTGTTESVWHIS